MGRVSDEGLSVRSAGGAAIDAGSLVFPAGSVTDLGNGEVLVDLTAGSSGRNEHLFNFRGYFDGMSQLTNSVVLQARVPQGHLIAMGARLENVLTSGTIQIRAKRNSTAITATNLNLNLNASLPLDNRIEHDVDDPAFLFQSGDILEVEITSTGFGPLQNELYLYATFKPI